MVVWWRGWNDRALRGSTSRSKCARYVRSPSRYKICQNKNIDGGVGVGVDGDRRHGTLRAGGGERRDENKKAILANA